MYTMYYFYFRSMYFYQDLQPHMTFVTRVRPFLKDTLEVFTICLNNNLIGGFFWLFVCFLLFISPLCPHCRHTARPFPWCHQHAVPYFHGCLWEGAGHRGSVQALQGGRGGPGEAALGHLWFWCHSLPRCFGCSPAWAPRGVCLRWLLV